MLKYLRLIDWLPLSTSALILVVVLWVMTSLFPQQYPTAKSEPRRSEYKETQNGQNEYAAIEAGAAVVGAIFTIVLACSTTLLWVVTRRTAKTAEGALIDLEGPFLHPVITSNNIQKSFSNFVVHDHPSSPHSPVQPVVKFSLKNYGRTLALPQSLIASLFFGVADEQFNETGGLTNEIQLGPGERSAEIERAMIRHISIANYQEIRDEKIRIFLRGTVIFWDIFGKGWMQLFCFAWNPKTDRFQIWGRERNRRLPFNPSKTA